MASSFPPLNIQGDDERAAKKLLLSFITGIRTAAEFSLKNV
jgi:hypothetical protein